MRSMVRTVPCAAFNPNSKWGAKTNCTAPPTPLDVTSVWSDAWLAMSFWYSVPTLNLSHPKSRTADGTRAVGGIAAEVARHAEGLEAQDPQRVIVKGEVAARAAGPKLVVAEAVVLNGGRGLARPDRALALERVEVQAHAQVKHLPALEAAHLNVPLVPLADAQPEIVRVGAADVAPC